MPQKYTKSILFARFQFKAKPAIAPIAGLKERFGRVYIAVTLPCRYKRWEELGTSIHGRATMTLAIDSESQALMDDLPEFPASETNCRRTLELFDAEITFISNPDFCLRDAVHDDAGHDDAGYDNTGYDNTGYDNTVEVPIQELGESQAPVDLPAELRSLCAAPLLPHQLESTLFGEMNYLKYRANAQRALLDRDNLDAQIADEILSLLDRSQAIRDHIIRANTRLVISIVKKFFTPQHSFDDLLSDGLFTLMHAVERFDYARGFRFSTYAYRCIVRNAHKVSTTSRQLEASFTPDVEAWASKNDGHSSSAIADRGWAKLRALAVSMLSQLDRREQFIIRSRYAICAHRRVRTFQCLADKLGISKERVRQLEQRGVTKLRSMAAELKIDEPFFAMA
jgi:RNA polymerase primary sigma factor